VRFEKPRRKLVLYIATLAVSWIALALVGAIQPFVGFLPILLLPAVFVTEAYFGFGPAIVCTIVCTGGAIMLMRVPGVVPEEVHNLSNWAVFPLVSASLLYVMESRRKQQRLGQERLIELSTLLESMPEAVFIFDPSGRLVEVNSAAVTFSGMRRDDLLNFPVQRLARHLAAQSDEDRPVDFASLAVTRALRGESVMNENRVFLPPPEHNRVEAVISASAMRGSQGEIIGALVVIRDVTELTLLQQRIAHTERHLAVGQMAAGIAHDFNNVLDTISQAASVLEIRDDRGAGETPDDRKLVLKMIHNAVRRGTEIIARLREYIRGGTGQQAPVDVRQLLEEALELTRPLWRNKDAQQMTVVRELNPVAPVLANAADLRRVFANLIINAIQAMSDGGTLTVHCEESGGTVVAWVRDTGIGITPEGQKKIFLPYYTTKPTGTGLGLSGAQKIVLSQQGNITFTSEPWKGSTFRIELPAIVEAPAKIA
jgi:PAS domain S-box-containing protein